MFFTQYVAQQFSDFINTHYNAVAKTGSSLKALPVIGDFLAGKMNFFSRAFGAQIENADLKDEKLISSRKFWATLNQLSILDLTLLDFKDNPNPQKTKDILKAFLKSELENKSDKLENANASANTKILFFDNELKKILEELESSESSEANGKIHFCEAYFRRILKGLINEELKKIEKIETAHANSKGSYDAILKLCLKVLDEIEDAGFDSYAEQYYSSSLDTRKEAVKPTSSASSNKLSVNPETIVNAINDHEFSFLEVLKSFMNQFLSAKMGYWHYDLNTFREASIIRTGTAAISSVIDLQISGDKKKALDEFSKLMQESLIKLRTLFSRDNKITQLVLQSSLFNIAEIEKTTKASLDEYKRPLVKVLESVRVRIRSNLAKPVRLNLATPVSAAATTAVTASAATATASATTASIATAAAGTTASATMEAASTAVAIVRPKTPDSLKTAMASNEATLPTVINGLNRRNEYGYHKLPKILDVSKRRELTSASAKEVVSLPQALAIQCINLWKVLCLSNFGLLGNYRTGVDTAKHFGIDPNKNRVLSFKMSSGGISSADVIHEVLSLLVYDDSNTIKINKELANQNPKEARKSITKIFEKEQDCLTELRSTTPTQKSHYDWVLECCFNFLKDMEFLDDYADCYLYSGTSSTIEQNACVILDLIRLYISLRMDYRVCDLKKLESECSIKISFPDGFGLPELDKIIIDKLSGVILEGIEQVSSELGEKPETLQILLQSILYSIQEALKEHTKNGSVMQKYYLELERCLKSVNTEINFAKKQTIARALKAKNSTGNADITATLGTEPMLSSTAAGATTAVAVVQSKEAILFSSALSTPPSKCVPASAYDTQRVTIATMAATTATTAAAVAATAAAILTQELEGGRFTENAEGAETIVKNSASTVTEGVDAVEVVVENSEVTTNASTSALNGKGGSATSGGEVKKDSAKSNKGAHKSMRRKKRK